ncbi:MAG: HAD-IIIC family phosphatase [Acidihalobacter sp.]|uniref:HAD-IIIC family phosphatase n=1 Tax=Acidihalobacter sp. TaxID=1872108 RepID=UPI00307E9341
MTGSTEAAAARPPAAIEKAQWQAPIFAPRPRRMELAALQPSWPLTSISVAVHRNTPFEYIAQAMPAFLAYAGMRADFRYSDYDDSLQFRVDEADDADVHVVWLDFERYRAHLEGTALADWLGERLRQLRQTTDAPLLVANQAGKDTQANAVNQAVESAVAPVPGARVYDRRPLLGALGDAFLDKRLAGIGATSLSGLATLLTARDLGLRWFPAAVRPRLKCIAVDFDNTLYAGVLGEDGPVGLTLTPAHAALQERLVALSREGILLAAVSKNEAADVERLLAERGDFPVRHEHFAHMAVSWESKSAGLARIADSLRIGLDAIVLVDDNPGEIAEVAAAMPMVRCVHGVDPELALAELTIGPDLLAWTGDETAGLRAADLEAAKARQRAVAEAADPLAYLGTLDTRLVFALNPRGHLARMHELSGKTNQFNLALKRLGEAALDRWFDKPGPRAVTIQLADRLSDSGIVGMMLFDTEGDTLRVEELCISCRALGRGLEDLMIATAITAAMKQTDCSSVAFAFATGPRNRPARDWLVGFSGRPLDAPQGTHRLVWPPAGLDERLSAIPVTVDWQ